MIQSAKQIVFCKRSPFQERLPSSSTSTSALNPLLSVYLQDANVRNTPLTRLLSATSAIICGIEVEYLVSRGRVRSIRIPFGFQNKSFGPSYRARRGCEGTYYHFLTSAHLLLLFKRLFCSTLAFDEAKSHPSTVQCHDVL